MNDQTDGQLLRFYAEHSTESAFAELVRRHLNFVYSAALRLVCDRHLAEDVTQSVFVALANNAARLTERTNLCGWLHQTAQNIAAQTVRTIERRRTREQEAVNMNQLLSSESETSWERITPHLDAALSELVELDRDALFLRYFKNYDLRTVGTTLGISDDAAQKRVSRAVERLREFLAKRGVTVGAAGLAVVISANAVQAAPGGLAVTITAAAIAGTAVSTSAIIPATKIIAMTTLQKAIVAATVAALTGAGIYEAREASQLREQNQTLQKQQAPLAEQIQQLQRERDEITNRLPLMAEEISNSKKNNDELLKLRGEVGVLQRQGTDANQRLHAAEEKLAAELSSKAQFEAHQSATTSAMKQLGLAMFSYSTEHGNQFPTNEVQISKELGGSFSIGGIDLGNFEFVHAGTISPDHPNMILLRERLAREAPDGTWKRIYGFADGRVFTATSNDGNFDAWEKANTYSPPANQ
ncbi:MAG TPA: sigma-70 family RNA polymerase sigma factor [Verrucomicrobiae bacterium]|nr:sigma-70 family RNA polymerase sigma factor [Verrucomicrobiae bacterium]